MDEQGKGWLYRRFEPAHGRGVPYARAWNISLRTAHLMAISLLVGGYAFSAPLGQLRLLLWLSIATGTGLVIVEAYPSLHFIFEGWWLVLVFKLVLLGIVRAAYAHRVALLLAVVALAGIGSHMPARFRRYSLLYRRRVDE